MSRSRKPVNPNAEQGLNRLKEETAAELGLQNYDSMYKGALTSADNGRVGGHMVRKMIEAQEQQFTSGIGATGGTTGAAGQQTITSKHNIGS
jgi:small acid-soluble spore protein D (minor alpha/beta-type SASP)